MQQLGGPAWGPQLLLSQGGCGEGAVEILSLLTLILATAAAPVDRSRCSHRVQDPSLFPDVAVGLGRWRAENKEPSEGKDRDRAELQRPALSSSSSPLSWGSASASGCGRCPCCWHLHIHCQSSNNPPPTPHTHFYPQQLPSLLQFPGRDLLLVVQMSQVYGLEVLSRGCSLICNQLATGQMRMVVQGKGHPTCCHHCPDLTTNSDA